MAVLGRGEGHGGISVLHALGAGYGCAVSIELSTRVQLRDTPVKREPEDPHGLLPAIVQAWTQAGHAAPEAEELHWAIRTDIPMGRGLKSSAALSIACIRALCEATETQLENHQMVDIATAAQLGCGCSLTGSVDDTWAAVETGWKVVDPGVPAAEGVLLEGQVDAAGDWTVMIIDRGPREIEPDPERFQMAAAQFQQAVRAIEQGGVFNAMIQNGRAVATALQDQVGRKACNDVGIFGARAASITGSGPAIAMIVLANQEASIRRIHQLLEPRGWSILETRFRTA